MSILVVDDAACFRLAARELLEQRGYLVAGEADCAGSAREAVERLAPDGVLLDVHLPDGDGVELATELVSNDPALAILLVSAAPLGAIRLPDGHPAGFVSKAELAEADLARFWPRP